MNTSTKRHEKFNLQYVLLIVLIVIIVVLMAVLAVKIYRNAAADYEREFHKAVEAAIDSVENTMSHSTDRRENVCKSYAFSAKNEGESKIRSLMVLVSDVEAVRNGSTGLKSLHVGKDYESFVRKNITRGSRLLTGTGRIRWGDLTMKCMLTENGELHGRYHNIDHNVDLDVNGYIKPNGDLYIQLGHGSEQSEWTLSPVRSEDDDSYRYEGPWGKKGIPGRLVFREE